MPIPQNEFDITPPFIDGGRFGNKIEIHMRRRLKDGKVLMYGSRYLFIGIDPLTLMEEVGREARLIIRKGYGKEFHDWCGLKYDLEPSSKEILAALGREGAFALPDHITL